MTQQMNLQEQAAYIEELEAENARLKKDAERLDFLGALLASSRCFDFYSDVGTRRGDIYYLDIVCTEHPYLGSSIRAAIDSAMEAEG